MLLHIPHSSVKIPDDVRSTLLLSDEQLHQELLRMTDWFTDLLFDMDGMKRLVYPVSRLVCDPERFAEDDDEPMAKVGMGAIYTRTSDGKILRADPTPEQRKSLLHKYYEPHHTLLTTAVEQILKEHGTCLIIDCHSFSSRPLPHEPDQRSDRPDICIGTDPFHTPPPLMTAAVRAFEEEGFSVACDRPFSGSIVPRQYYRKDQHVRSFMVEVNRALYMDEQSGMKSPGFSEVHSCIISALAKMDSHP